MVVSTADGDSIAVGVEFTSGIVLQLGNGDRTINVDSSFIGDLCGSAGRIFAEGKDTCVVIGTVSFDSFVEDQLTVIGDLNTAAVGEISIDSNSTVIDDLEGCTCSQSQIVVSSEDDVLPLGRSSGVFHIHDVVEHCGSAGCHIAGEDQRSRIASGKGTGAFLHVTGDCQIIGTVADGDSTVVGDVRCDRGDSSGKCCPLLDRNRTAKVSIFKSGSGSHIDDTGITVGQLSTGTADNDTVGSSVVDTVVGDFPLDINVSVDRSGVGETAIEADIFGFEIGCTDVIDCSVEGIIGSVDSQYSILALDLDQTIDGQFMGIAEVQDTVAGDLEPAAAGSSDNSQDTARNHTILAFFGEVFDGHRTVNHDPGGFLADQIGVFGVIPDRIFDYFTFMGDIGIDDLRFLQSGDTFKVESVSAVGFIDILVIFKDTAAFTANDDRRGFVISHHMQMER